VPEIATDLALQALLSAVWRRKPKHKIMIHSDQGSQLTGKEWQSFLGKHNLDASLSSFACKRLPVQHEPPWKLS
jgi:putative transposase